MTASATASVPIAADPATVYALITDLTTMADLAEEAYEMRWHKGSAAAAGAVFKGKNRNGAKTWTTTCTVTDAEPGRSFAFDVKAAGIPVAHWRYDICVADHGCTVTESTWDRRPGWFKALAGRATGVPDRDSTNAKHIARTLERLKSVAEAR